MQIRAVKDNLFRYEKEYALVHCISADFRLGAGIAKEFDRRYNMRQRLAALYPTVYTEYYNSPLHGDTGYALYVNTGETKVINLVTKFRYFQKPTYASIENALIEAKKVVIKENIKKIAMPLIGCGLDKLEWKFVVEIIKEVFTDTDVDILVCEL